MKVSSSLSLLPSWSSHTSVFSHLLAIDRSLSTPYLSLMIINNASKNAKEHLSSVEEQLKGTSKAHASALILKLL
ncbi:hypothetical protein Tco_0127234, partial [Tanacetum coccineum]